MKMLANKVAVITGGSRGLGFVIAQAYAREGAAAVIASRSASSVDAFFDDRLYRPQDTYS